MSYVKYKTINSVEWNDVSLDANWATCATLHITSASRSVHDRGIAFITAEFRNTSPEYAYTPRFELQVNFLMSTSHTAVYQAFAPTWSSTIVNTSTGHSTRINIPIPIGFYDEGSGDGLRQLYAVEVQARTRASEAGTRLSSGSIHVEYKDDGPRNIITGTLGSNVIQSTTAFTERASMTLRAGTYNLNAFLPVRFTVPDTNEQWANVTARIRTLDGTFSELRRITMDSHKKQTSWWLGDTLTFSNISFTLPAATTMILETGVYTTNEARIEGALGCWIVERHHNIKPIIRADL